MPRRDGTGPMGMGSMTGRGAGFCAGFAAPGYMNRGIGHRAGIGRGCGFRRMHCPAGMSGWQQGGYSAYSGVFAPAAGEKEYLNKQAELLKNQLQQIDKRLKEISGDDE